MAIKISDLVAATTLSDTDIIYVRTTGAIDKKITGTNLKQNVYKNLLHIQDEKTQNTDGGTFTHAAWRTRDLNTVKTNEIIGASLASNQITLPIGTYFIRWSCPAFDVEGHQSRLYNITDAAVEIVGLNAHSSLQSQTKSHGEGRFTIAGEKVFEIQHRGSQEQTTTGFGLAANFTTEVYSMVLIRRIV